jgi:hypothetical protein
MKIYMDMDYIVGRLRYGHLEGEIDFTKEQEKDFKTLLKKELNKEEITEEELDRLDGYKEDIRGCSEIIVDDWRIDDCGDYHWEELLED